MLVSCILPTFNRRRFLPQALRCFLGQDYAERELIVIDDGTDCVRDLVPDDPRIHYLRQEKQLSVGRKRNLACERARGEVVVHWDDDDWSAPWRLSYQVEQLRSAKADLCGLDRIFFYAPEENRAWEYSYQPSQRPWVYGASLCYTRDFWQRHPFPEINIGEDNRFVWNAARPRIHRSEDARFLVAVIHGANTSRKRTADRRYQPRDVSVIEEILGDAKQFYRALRESPGGSLVLYSPAAPLSPRTENQKPLPPPAKAKPRALVTAALGLGDILRMTPLIRALGQLGYEVDVLLSTDYPETTALLHGAPEIRAVFSIPTGRKSIDRNPAVHPVAGLPSDVRNVTYDVALFTTWSVRFLGSIRTKRALRFDRKTWLAEGDFRSSERLARELGWKDKLPPPFVRTSDRSFDLLPGTVALHPGCKADWPWKKWHGFAELAGLFPRVVIVGTAEDLRVAGTYFSREYTWPPHARNFVGELTLADTAALLKECAAVVSNDSGIMHLATALGRPTFGIFGITSPSREGLPFDNFHPITKGLSCEAACRCGSWGRRDCEHHLACLKTLTPEEVFMKVTEVVPSTRGAPAALLEVDPLAAPVQSTNRLAGQNRESHRTKSRSPSGPSPQPGGEKAEGTAPRETIRVMYYGYVFDASGYGNAARGYLHALHTAGIDLSVVDLANHGRQVRDPLVESLVSRRIDADFHLFHGIPPQWARRAFPLNNVIAMTVWETDLMPSTWRPALNHATQVWLPCDYNVKAFASALSRPVVKVPHAWRPNHATPANDWVGHCGAKPGDFVFYSIFEWQERKGPAEMIEAFLRAFPEPASRVVLILKTNHNAFGVASKTLAEIRGRVRSEARIELRAEAWSEEQVAALSELGDAYVSLHHGEGWNYPLFEAAARGKAIVATGFSGPLEYLDPSVHKLVRHRPAPVRQRYAYYSTTMHWAEPDVPHAAECLRAVYDEGNRSQAARAVSAERIRNEFSLDMVGQAARRHLHDLLRRTNAAKWQRLETAARLALSKPAIPISGDWYDADYFEHGRKSNWSDGYIWDNFSGLFRETAEFAKTTFADARSFLDAGCAKGFLVKALREAQREARGFDHSRWAIEHAESNVLPHLEIAGAEDPPTQRNHDVLLCFDLLQSLTEIQAVVFLTRIRPCIQQAMLAVIPLAQAEADGTEDRDLARVTLRSRAWWNELFLRAGWRQDSLHKLAERQLQTQALPSRMGWNVFLYSPQ